MPLTMPPTVRRAWGRAIAGGLLLLGAACAEDRTAPSPAADPGAAPLAAADTSGADSGLTDTLAIADGGVTGSTVLEQRGTAPGIVFGSTNMDPSLLGSVHTGTLRGGGVTESNVISLLSAARSKNARVVLKMCNGKDSYVKNPDGTFSLTKWKGLVDRFRRVDLGPYITDGTLLGHYLIDEPQRASRWGGKAISPATIEAMAQYSKQIWPTLTTFVRAQPTWLATSSVTYRYLDAGWAQYASGKGSASTWVAAEVAAAKRKGLGLAVGINALDGGNGSSKIPGDTRGQWAMSATEVRSYGAAMLAQSYACAFYNYHYDQAYYGRSDIESAFADLSSKARTHARTSCRQ